MLRRNPHVFGDHKVENLEDIGLMWNSVKQAEKEAKKKRAI
jgi:uncharacterized protein YabN with tetrapyrrole methylase and pyrophosphatase domain